MKEDIPLFDLDINNTEAKLDALEFHNRIIEFIKLNLAKEGEATELLCYMLDSENGQLMEATLPRNAYRQSLLKSLEFFTDCENYEKCIELKDLLSKI